MAYQRSQDLRVATEQAAGHSVRGGSTGYLPWGPNAAVNGLATTVCISVQGVFPLGATQSEPLAGKRPAQNGISSSPAPVSVAHLYQPSNQHSTRGLSRSTSRRGASSSTTLSSVTNPAACRPSMKYLKLAFQLSPSPANPRLSRK